MKFIRTCAYLSLVVLLFTAMYCATATKVISSINDIASDYCIYVLSTDEAAVEAEKLGVDISKYLNIESICRVQRNIDYFVDIFTNPDSSENVDINGVLMAAIKDGAISPTKEE